MITLRVDEDALRAVLRLALLTDHQTPSEVAAIRHVANQSAQSVIDEIEQHLEIDVPEVEGVPI